MFSCHITYIATLSTEHVMFVKRIIVFVESIGLMQMRSNFCNDAEIARVRDVVWSSCVTYNIANVVYDIVRMNRLLSGSKKSPFASLRFNFVSRKNTRSFLISFAARYMRCLCVNLPSPLYSTTVNFYTAVASCR